MLRLGFWLCLCAAWGGATAVCAAGGPRTDRCVILISVDGLAGFYLDDPKAELPTLRRLAQEGTRTDGLESSFPTVTWPNHTTLVTGVTPSRHGVLGNSYLDRTAAATVSLLPDPLFDKHEIVKTPTIYDVAHAAGLRTAGIVWPATRSARTLDWTVPDMFGDDAWAKYGTADWLAELRAAGIPIERHGAWVKEASGGVQRDWLYTRMLAHVMQHHAPNLVLIHLVEVDHVQHKYGPRTPEAYWSVSFADDRLRDIVEAVERSPRRGQTTILVASDHGFFPITRDIRPNVVLRQLGLQTAEKKQAMMVSQGGACMLYVLDDARRAEILQQLRTAFEGVEGVASVHGAEDFAKLGQATPDQDRRAPDLWLAAEMGYSFTDSKDGEDPVAPRSAPAGTHGFRPGHPDMRGTLVLSGAGVKPGVRLGAVSNLDVAPTMAKLLGVDLPDTDGRPLTDALTGK